MKQVLSLGLGVQSTALYLMSALGELPRIDYAVFADPGREKKKTVEYLTWLLQWAKDNAGPEIIVITEKNLYQDLLANTNSTGERFASIPAFTETETSADNGILRRQCTNEYKIAQVDQVIRKRHGLVFRERNIPTAIWKGISIEEASRMSIPEAKWKHFIYPFTGYGIPGKGKWYRLPDELYKPMARDRIMQWYRDRNLPIPPKSSCVFCPYMSDAQWYDMKTNEPEDFSDAVKVDEAIRDSSKRGVTQKIYIHRSLKPLDQVNFDKNNHIEFGECSGTCGV